jgi:hypothetical protein
MVLSAQRSKHSSIAKNLSLAGYWNVAPIQFRHSDCHNSCTNRHGHPDVDSFPPTENVVGISREELEELIVDTPSKCTRSKTARLRNDPDRPTDQAPGSILARSILDSPASRTRQYDSPASNQDESGGSGGPLPATGKRPNRVNLFDYVK